MFVSVTVGLGQSFRIGGHGAYFHDVKFAFSDDTAVLADFDSEWGYGVQLEGRFNKYVGIELAGSTVNYEWSGTGFDYEYGDYQWVLGMDIYVLFATLKFCLPVSDYFGLYLGGGAGYFIGEEYLRGSSASGYQENIKGRWSETWGYHGCAGAEFMLGKHFSLFGDYRYSRFDDTLRNARDYGTEDMDHRVEVGIARVGVNVVF